MLKRQSYLDLPYPQAVQKCSELGDELRNQFKQYFIEYIDVLDKKFDISGRQIPAFEDVDIEYIENCDFLFTSIYGSYSTTVFSIDTKIRTKLNALEAGIRLLIQYPKTKKIPKTIPFNSPKDLFSNKPFLIIKTEDGFKLKCQGEDLSRSQIKKKTEKLDIKPPDNISFDNEIHEYEFKLPKD